MTLEHIEPIEQTFTIETEEEVSEEIQEFILISSILNLNLLKKGTKALSMRLMNPGGNRKKKIYKKKLTSRGIKKILLIINNLIKKLKILRSLKN